MKKQLTAIGITVIMTLGIIMPGFAYNFPEPDWGALLHERENMVNETEFELYAEADPQTAPYFGARLEPRSGAYIGMIAESSEEFAPLGNYLTYIQDMGQDDLYYPASDIISEHNSAAMIGWTINSLDVDYGQISRVLSRLNNYGKPMFIRFANEMNVSALGDDPDKYISVFRTVANMVHEYPNFAMVWSPNDLGALDRPFDYYYPGDEYVDWVGVSCYSLLYFQGNPNTSYKDSVYFMTGDYAWATNRIKPFMEFLSRNNINKPVMISEGGVTTNTSFEDAPESWTAPRLRNMMWYLVMKYPQIKMINYFNTHREGEALRYDISDYPYASQIFSEAESSGAYIREAGGSPGFVFMPASSAGTLAAEDGAVRLYTLAHTPGQSEVTVNYYIDGNWTHSASQIPYIFNLIIYGLSDGAHTLRISALDHSMDYTFYKRGNAIRFGAEPDNLPAESEISVTVDGQKLNFDQPPIMESDRVLVPVRAIFEALGADVFWDESQQTATAERGGKTIIIPVDEKYMTVSGNRIELDVPARLVNNRTLVPARVVSEALGCTVNWDDSTQTVIITN